MERKHIDPHQFITQPFTLFDKQWFLLTSGELKRKRFNCMTISWGSMGIMWNKPFIMVAVRPTRYTYEFMNNYETFTVCTFSGQYRSTLDMLGSRSGRDEDKIAASGLTPIASKIVDAPSYDEAELIIECKKMYWQDYEPLQFLNPAILLEYPKKDYHRMFFGEILEISGIKSFVAGKG
jgi:flavin reductase (DIM6/NTAB) family NADH-FMN oxidoreductase RutF